MNRMNAMRRVGHKHRNYTRTVALSEGDGEPGERARLEDIARSPVTRKGEAEYRGGCSTANCICKASTSMHAIIAFTYIQLSLFI